MRDVRYGSFSSAGLEGGRKDNSAMFLGGTACTALVDLEFMHVVCILESKGIDTNDNFRSNAMLITKAPILQSQQQRNATASRSLITKSVLGIPELHSRASHSHSYSSGPNQGSLFA